MVAGTRSALIIASSDYTDVGLRRLRAPASDARALGAVLHDPGIGGFEVRTLLNDPAHEVNLAVEEFFADRQPDDLLLMHFSCHGVKDEDGELYFAMANTQLRRLGATAVAADFVNRRMSRSRSRRVVLLLDCCYAGAFERGMTARAGTAVGIESQFGGRGRAVITASSAMEYAFEGDQLADTNELAPSVFTSALVEGLQTGDADRDQDGVVALDELYDYIYDRVRTATPHQTPGKWTFGIQGELVIARRALPVTTPAPLPPGLREALDSPLAAVRGGAVQELARLLDGMHAGLALAARRALEGLTEDDSRTVATAATAALSAQTQQPPGQGPLIPPPDAAPAEDRITASKLTTVTPSGLQRASGSSASADAARDGRQPAASFARPRWPRRRTLFIAAAAVLAAAGAVTGLLILNSSPAPRQTGHHAGHIIRESSPWRLIVQGGYCTLTLTNTGTGETQELTNGGPESFQIHETGTFQWKTDKSGCPVTQSPGTGSDVLPHFYQSGKGDTNAFGVSGRVAVDVKDFGTDSTCVLNLISATDGGQVDQGTAHTGKARVLLDPKGRRLVYIKDLRCSVDVTPE